MLREERQYFKPFNYPWAYDKWLKHEQSHWLHTEVPMVEDVKDWKKKLNESERNFLTNIFRFFTQGDIDVAGGYVTNYIPHFPQPEVRMMLLGFAAREALHVAAYSHLIETLGMPESTYSEFAEYEEMRAKHDYIMDLSSKNGTIESTAAHIAAFSAFTEGMQLFSSFIMLLNFPRHGKMKGMGQIEGLTSDEVKEYIRYIADRRLISMGMRGIFKRKVNPLPWVEEMINAPTHTNFFENRATDYAKGSLSGTWDKVWGKAA